MSRGFPKVQGFFGHNCHLDIYYLSHFLIVKITSMIINFLDFVNCKNTTKKRGWGGGDTNS